MLRPLHQGRQEQRLPCSLQPEHSVVPETRKYFLNKHTNTTTSEHTVRKTVEIISI